QCHGVSAGNRSRAADAAERVLFLFDAGGTLEGESGRRAVPEVPDVTVHALLARSARVDDDRIAAAVRHGHDHTPAARAASFSLPGGTSGARVEGGLERLPAHPADPTVPQRGVGSEDQEAAQVRILAYHARRNVLREALADVDPRLAPVAGLVDVRPPVVELMAVDRDVRRACVERRDPDLVHPPPHAR